MCVTKDCNNSPCYSVPKHQETIISKHALKFIPENLWSLLFLLLLIAFVFVGSHLYARAVVFLLSLPGLVFIEACFRADQALVYSLWLPSIASGLFLPIKSTSSPVAIASSIQPELCTVDVVDDWEQL